MGKFAVETVFSAKDHLSGPMRRMGNEVASLGRKMRGGFASADRGLEKLRDSMGVAFKGFGTVAAVATAGLAAGGAALATSANAALDFQAQMANVSTIIDTNTESIAAMGAEVLDIASRTPVPIAQLTDALYDVRSAGISAADQFMVLEKSAQLGAAGLGTTKEAVDVVTSAINAFALEGKDADLVYDQIFRTVRDGKTTISGLAQGFGGVAATVANTGTKLDEYLSAVAALTTTGAPASQAHTQLKAVFSGLTRETTETTKVFRALGAQNLPDLIAQSGGFVPALEKIRTELGGDASAMLKLVGSTEALNAAMALTGNIGDTQRSTLEGMRSGVDALGGAFDKQSQSSAARLQMMKNNVERLQISIGNKLLPIVDKVATAISNWVNANGQIVADKIGNFIKAAEPLLEIFTDTFMSTITAIGEGLATMFPPGQGDGEAWAATIKTLAVNLGELAAMTVVVVAGVSALIAGVGLYLSAVWSAWKGIGTAIVDILGGIIFAVTDWWANLKALFSAEGMGLAQKTFEIGKHLVMGLVNGIKSLARMPFDVLKNIATGALNGVKGALGIKSPSKEMAKLGAFTAEGFSLGIDRKLPEISAAFSRMATPANDVMPQVSSGESAMADRLDNLVQMRAEGEVVIRDQTGRAEARSGGSLAIRVVSTGAA